MIRRHVGQHLYLFPQHEHARLSGHLATHFGNARFAKPDPAPDTIQAAFLHDAGWPLHDDQPTLNNESYPLDVFETPLELALRIWRESADRAARESDYTQLLVSLHVLSLSGYAASHPHTRRELFELNKFQQHEIERQETLRARLNLATDIPLHLGLAEHSPLPAERQLCHNLGILQLADQISLSLCCTELVFPEIPGITPNPDAKPVTLNLRRHGPWSLEIDPWPFDEPLLSVTIPYRVVPSRRYETVSDLRQQYAASPIEKIEFTVKPANCN